MKDENQKENQIENQAKQNTEQVSEDLIPEKNPLWKSGNLKELRLRLGLSQCDLARKLATSTETIRHWEDGKETIASECMVQLEILRNQADMCSNEILSQPRAEMELEAKDLNQIESSTI